jgi:hypothetical protein
MISHSRVPLVWDSVFPLFEGLLVTLGVTLGLLSLLLYAPRPDCPKLYAPRPTLVGQMPLCYTVRVKMS